MTHEDMPASVDFPLAGAILTVDLDALGDNYRALAQVAAPARAAGVVKANAYGLGIGPVARTLLDAGCRDFFVAFAPEGAALRKIAPDATIFVLGGLFGEDGAAAYGEHRLVPVLNSLSDIRIWEGYCGRMGRRLPCAIHVDTGMNRLGLTPEEALAFAEDNRLTGAISPVLVVSHLVCADQPEREMNRRQFELFQQVASAFSGVESSLENSAGILFDPDWHFDLARPGIALYGGAPVSGVENPMRNVVTVEARIVQIRTGLAGETVSYGAAHRLERDTQIAVAALGYGDGYPRIASSANGGSAQGFIAGRRVPVIGRITMDAMMFDITDLAPDSVTVGDWIEMIGPNMPIDEVAAAAGTISYELLTNLGTRFHRRYVKG